MDIPDLRDILVPPDKLSKSLNMILMHPVQPDPKQLLQNCKDAAISFQGTMPHKLLHFLYNIAHVHNLAVLYEAGTVVLDGSELKEDLLFYYHFAARD